MMRFTWRSEMPFLLVDVHDAMPVAQRLVRVFEDRANRVREPVAFRGAFRPAARDQVGAASVFVPDMASNSGMVSWWTAFGRAAMAFPRV
jgi:hypothetical protein